MDIQKENIKNILLIKLCCLGDIIFFTPVIENLRGNFPEAKITLLCSTWLKNIVPYVKNVDEVIFYEGPYEKSFFKKAASTLSTILRLRNNKYDLAIVGHRNNFYGMFTKLCGITYRLGYEGTKHLTHTVDFNSEKHIVDKNIALLNPLNLTITKRETVLKRLEPVDEIKKLHNIPSDKKIIGIFPFGGVNPGTEMNIKRWDINNFYEVINSISQDYFVILFEGKEQNEKVSQDFLIGINVALKTMENDLLSVCDVFLAGDTGPLHIAAAMGVNTVALFGPSDADLLKPRANLRKTEDNAVHELIWKKPYCSPCYTPVTAADRNNPKYWRNGSFICHTGTHICMKSITVEEVAATIKKINLNK